MGVFDDDVVQDYLGECREHLAGIESDLLDIERRGADIDEDLVNRVFRAAHSIKGGAAFFDFNRIRELAHRTENVLDLIRSRQAVPTPELVSGLLLAFDKLRAMIENPGESEQAEIGDCVKMLQDLTEARLPADRKDSVRRNAVISTPGRETLLTATAFDLEVALASGKQVYLLEYDLLRDIQRKGRRPLEVVRELMRYGVILDTAFDLDSVGTLDDSPSNRIALDILYATALGSDTIGSVVEISPERIWIAGRTGECRPLDGPTLGIGDPDTENTDERLLEPAPKPVALPVTDGDGSAVLPRLEAEGVNPAAASAASTGQASTVAPADGQPADATVRLNVTLLDALMNLAGELVLGRNQLNDAIASRDLATVQTVSQRIGAVTSDMQEAVMRTRMQPVGNLFQRFPRLARDTARKLGKEVRLVEEGADVELDKTIIEGLSDPLTHMVRNAIDHGIESPADRAACGKPSAGTVRLSAWHEAGLVVIEVADDGRGLDAERIASSAVSKGLVGPEAVAAMKEEEKLALVFLPGLSTSKTVSDISGRGVGMDVVKTNLDRLGGEVEIHSQLGKGVAFRIKLPLTLAIIPSLLVSSAGERMAIPLLNVQELVRIPASEIGKRIDRVGSASVLMLRDGLVPLVDLARVLDLSHGETSRGAINVVILSGGSFHYGLIVEQLHGTVEIVVKPLGSHVKHLREYAGATILGDGCVALILDVVGLAAVAGLAARDGRPQNTRSAAAAPEETHHLLLFHNSRDEVCALPLHGVSRVVKIRPEQVEHVGGRRTMQHRQQSLPLAVLSDIARVAETTLDQNSIVVVMEVAGRPFGLLASLPVDVVEVALDIDTRALRQPGVVGSAILRGRTTLVLDSSELARSTELAENPDAGRQTQPAFAGATVLIAEDSAFFREQVTRILEEAGCTVLATADGQEAWEMLERSSGIALLITDIEMPRMDGLELTRRIRAAAGIADLPVVMLTSLAGEEDIERGRVAGASAYCIKLDRDQLLAILGHCLTSGSHRTSTATEDAGLNQLSRRVRGETETATANIGEGNESSV